MQPGTAVQGKSLEALATKPEQNTTHAGQQRTAGNSQLPASHIITSGKTELREEHHPFYS
jgi:hypothetical protein